MDNIVEHDSVKNKVKVKDIPVNTNGCVVHIYPSNHSVVEVEFFDENAVTLGVETVNVLDLKKI